MSAEIGRGSQSYMALEYPHINLAQIYAVLAYYHANRNEIDHELETETAEPDLYSQH